MNNKTVELLQIRDIILPFSNVLTPFMGLLKKIIFDFSSALRWREFIIRALICFGTDCKSAPAG
jgi:hypothetical protein